MHVAQSSYITQKQRLMGRTQAVMGSLPLPAGTRGIARCVFVQLTRKEEKACERATD